MKRYKINKKKCKGCGQCYEICPEGAVEEYEVK
jgi:formate hydrogenlyase subunit 6/NADH:ubiquinone oxidoreductase subunit I